MTSIYNVQKLLKFVDAFFSRFFVLFWSFTFFKGHKGHFIPSSQVNDGICDCCDGSDEWENKDVTCPNKCKELGEKVRQERVEKLKDHKVGLEAKLAYIEKARKEIPEKRAKKEELTASILTAENVVQEAQRKKDSAELDWKAVDDEKQARVKRKIRQEELEELEKEDEETDEGAGAKEDVEASVTRLLLFYVIVVFCIGVGFLCSFWCLRKRKRI